MIRILAVDVLLVAAAKFIGLTPAMIVTAPLPVRAAVRPGCDPRLNRHDDAAGLNLGNNTLPVSKALITAARIVGITRETIIRQSLPVIQ
ncbi:MAG: hypothetical protein ACE5EU_08770 [Paracoccaceae bacterium]